MSSINHISIKKSTVKIAILFCLITILQSCNTASIRFYNRASDTYELFIDGKSQGDIPANSFINISVEEGYHKFKVTQKDGFVFSATEYEKGANVVAGKNLEWSWGNMILPSN